MAANTSPIFGLTPSIQGVQTSNQGTSTVDGTGANVAALFQAGATNGSWVDEVRLKPISAPAATVVRIFVCSVTGAYTAGTSNTTSNTFCIAEITLAAAPSSTTAAQNDISIPIRKALPPGYRLLLGYGTATGASTGYAVTTFAADY